MSFELPISTAWAIETWNLKLSINLFIWNVEVSQQFIYSTFTSKSSFADFPMCWKVYIKGHIPGAMGLYYHGICRVSFVSHGHLVANSTTQKRRNHDQCVEIHIFPIKSNWMRIAMWNIHMYPMIHIPSRFFTCSFSTILEKNDQSEDFALWENLSFSTRSGRSGWGFGFIKLGFWSNNKYQICPSSFVTYLPFALYKCITIIVTNWPPVASVQNHLQSTSYAWYSPTFLRVKGVSKLDPQPVF